MEFVNNAREARGENFSILHLKTMDFKKMFSNAREARGENFSILHHFPPKSPHGDGGGTGRGTPRVLSKIFAARGGGGVPPPPLGFYLKFLTPGAHRGNRVKVFKNRKTKGGVGQFL